MISKSKLKKLEADLAELGVSQEAQAKAAKTTRVTLVKVYNGESKKEGVVERLIALRDKKIQKNKSLEKAI